MHKYTNTDKFTTTIVGFSQSCVEYFALVGILLCTGSGKLWKEAVVWKQGATNPLPRMKIGTYCNALLWFDKGVWFQYHALLCKYHYALHITLHIFLFIFAQSKMLCTSFAQIAMFFAFLTDVSGQMLDQGGELGPKSRKIITRVGQNSYKHSFTVAMRVIMAIMVMMMMMFISPQSERSEHGGFLFLGACKWLM